MFMLSGLSRFHIIRIVGRIVGSTLFIASIGLVVWVVYPNYAAGCFWAPKEVPYYPGMTICPGQTAVGHILIQRAARRQDEL